MVAQVTVPRPRTLVPPANVAPLAGYTVAVASDRRRHPLTSLLEAVGAKVVNVQAVRAFSAIDENATRSATLDAVAQPIDELVVASDFGFRAWLLAAEGWDLRPQLLARFGSARLLASNPRAADALRELGLHEIWSTAAASTEELVRYLLAQPLRGRRIVVQSDGVTTTELCGALRVRGADVVEVSTFQHQPPVHADLLRRLGEHARTRLVDAIVFTAAPAVDYLLAQADLDHRRDDLLNVLVDGVAPLCLSEDTAQPLRRNGLDPPTPAVPFFEELVALACVTLPERAVHLRTSLCRVEVRGQAVIVDDELIPLPPGPMTVLRALAGSPGRVLSCADIRAAVPHWAGVDDHAIEMAVSRLRRALPNADLIQTVVRRGYRLAA